MNQFKVKGGFVYLKGKYSEEDLKRLLRILKASKGEPQKLKILSECVSPSFSKIYFEYEMMGMNDAAEIVITSKRDRLDLGSVFTYEFLNEIIIAYIEIDCIIFKLVNYEYKFSKKEYIKFIQKFLDKDVDKAYSDFDSLSNLEQTKLKYLTDTFFKMVFADVLQKRERSFTNDCLLCLFKLTKQFIKKHESKK